MKFGKLLQVHPATSVEEHVTTYVNTIHMRRFVSVSLSLSLSCVVRLVLCVFVTDLQYSIYYITLTYHVTTLHSVLCYSILDNTILDYTSLCLLIPSCSVVSYDSILYSAIYTTFLALHTFVSPFSYIPL